MTRQILTVAIVVSIFCITAPVSSKPTVTFTTFDVPDSQYTVPTGINDDGKIVGFFGDITGQHGFLRSSDGSSYIIFDFIARGINNMGTIVGDVGVQSVLRTPNGALSFFSVPGSVRSEALGINSIGQVVGDTTSGAMLSGFIRSADGLNFTLFNIPGEGDTFAFGINDNGQVVGQIASLEHGFLRNSDGSITFIDFPGAAFNGAQGINNKGDIAGLYGNVRAGPAFGFLRSSAGTFTTIEVPNSSDTEANGINNLGQIVGIFETSASPGPHGFIAVVALFAGTPGFSNCHGESVAALAQQFSGLNAAAAALGFPSVQALQNAIRVFCAG